MSKRVVGLNDKAFELAFRLFEEYRARIEQRKQYNLERSRQYLLEQQDRARSPPSDQEAPPIAEEDISPLEDILSTIDDEDKRREFKAFIELLPIMIEESHGLCTGLDGKTIEDALTKDVTSKDVMKYLAQNAFDRVKGVAGSVASYVRSSLPSVKDISDYTRKVYHGFWPGEYQDKVAWTKDVCASSKEMSMANADAQTIIGAGAICYSIAYLAIMQQALEGYEISDGDPVKMAMIGMLGAVMTGEGLLRSFLVERTGEPMGCSFGTMLYIPTALKGWYQRKKKEIAMKRLKFDEKDDDPKLMPITSPPEKYSP